MSEPGSAAEEAARLLSTVEDWVRSRRADPQPGARPHLADGSAACALCPICQAVAALRKVRPETVEHLLDAAASLVAAVRTAAPDGPSASPRSGSSGSGSSGSGSSGSGSSGSGSSGSGSSGSGSSGVGAAVQHIDVQEEPC